MMARFLPLSTLLLMGGCATIDVKVDVLDPSHVSSRLSETELSDAVARLLAGDPADRLAASAVIIDHHLQVAKACDLKVAELLRAEEKQTANASRKKELIDLAVIYDRSASDSGQQARREETTKYLADELGRADATARTAIEANAGSASAAMRIRAASYQKTTEEVFKAPCTLSMHEGETIAEAATQQVQKIKQQTEEKATSQLAPQIKDQVTAAQSIVGAQTAGAPTLLGSRGESLIDSRAAYIVAAADCNPKRDPTCDPKSVSNWKPFNHALAKAKFGNSDLIIKLNDTADFTVKGFTFDASKTAELIGRLGVSTVGLIAGATTGMPVAINAPAGTTTEATLSIPANQMLTNARTAVAVDAARQSAFDAALRAMAAAIMARKDRLGSDATARQAVRAVYDAHKDVWKAGSGAEK